MIATEAYTTMTPPNTLSDFTGRIATRYTETLEAFARSLGITEDNAAECELRQYLNDPGRTELWRGQRKLGTITTRWDTSLSRVQWIIECYPERQETTGDVT